MRSGAGHSGAIPDVDPKVSAEGGRLPAKVGWVGNPEPAYRSGSVPALPGGTDRSLLHDGQAVRRRPLGFELSRCPSERDGRIPTVLHVPAALPLRADHGGQAPRHHEAQNRCGVIGAGKEHGPAVSRHSCRIPGNLVRRNATQPTRRAAARAPRRRPTFLGWATGSDPCRASS